MKWNWQKPSWPIFSYKDKELETLEVQFLRQSGVFLGAIRHIDDKEQKKLTVEFLSTEALKSSEIEGEILNRDSVQSSIQRHFGLKSSDKKIPPAEQGIAEMMVSLYQTFQSPLSHEQLFSWHKALARGRKDLQDIGAYRSQAEPMRVVSGPIHQPKIHFEAPPSDRMRSEMDAFIQWFNESAPGKNNSLPALTRAGIAHLHFVSIHPFEDGNGRIGRAIAEKSLSQSLERPTLIALSQAIESDRKKYYQQLELNNKSSAISGWLEYFAHTILTAQKGAQALIDFLIEKTKLFEKVRGHLNPRQEKVLERMFREGPKGFEGGLNAENYLRLTKTSRATATRDLQELVEMGAFDKKGELRHTRYFLKLP